MAATAADDLGRPVTMTVAGAPQGAKIKQSTNKALGKEQATVSFTPTAPGTEQLTFTANAQDSAGTVSSDPSTTTVEVLPASTSSSVSSDSAAVVADNALGSARKTKTGNVRVTGQVKFKRGTPMSVRQAAAAAGVQITDPVTGVQLGTGNVSASGKYSATVPAGSTCTIAADALGHKDLRKVKGCK